MLIIWINHTEEYVMQSKQSDLNSRIAEPEWCLGPRSLHDWFSEFTYCWTHMMLGAKRCYNFMSDGQHSAPNNWYLVRYYCVSFNNRYSFYQFCFMFAPWTAIWSHKTKSWLFCVLEDTYVPVHIRTASYKLYDSPHHKIRLVTTQCSLKTK